MSIEEHIQQTSLGREIKLFHLDLTIYGEGHLYLTPGDENDVTHAVEFDNQVYSPYPIQTEGYVVSSSGPPSRPSITIANASGILTALVRNNRNLEGAKVERFVTFAKFLDDGEDPDPGAITERHTHYILRKVADRPATGMLKFELGSLLDLEDSLIPARVVARDFCDLDYRVYVPLTDSFDYSQATCPWTGTIYLDAQDQACAKSQDVCSKRLNGGCRGRFGSQPLPFGGFPGVSRYRA